jgi:hypothetical protein
MKSSLVLRTSRKSRVVERPTPPSVMPLISLLADRLNPPCPHRDVRHDPGVAVVAVAAVRARHELLAAAVEALLRHGGQALDLVLLRGIGGHRGAVGDIPGAEEDDAAPLAHDRLLVEDVVVGCCAGKAPDVVVEQVGEDDRVRLRPCALIFEPRAMMSVPGFCAPVVSSGSPRTTVPGSIVSVEPFVT